MKKIMIIALLSLIVMTLSGCKPKFENPNPDYCEEGAIEGVYKCTKSWTSVFDTTISLTLYVTSTDTYDFVEIFENVYDILWKYHVYFDKYNAYSGINNVYTINQNNDQETVIDQELYDAIEYVLAEEQTILLDGVSLFNIALGPVLNIWHNIREACEMTSCPAPSLEPFEAEFNINPDDILLNPQTKSISFAKPDMIIDLGGFGKGYVQEKVTDYLDDLNIRYLLNAGNSNVKSGGINPNNEDGNYYIALIEPNLEFSFSNTYFVYLKVPGGMALVTSGNYQRFFIGIEDDVVYHHIIDPRTYLPGGEAMSVTVITEDGGLGDIYSTAVFLMSVEEGKTFVEATEGLEAIWYKTDGTVEYSSGFGTYIFELFPNRA